ncbi:chemotaxis protein CheW [Chamaesiphon sp. VAR_48_metabat_403]|uniref:chemotaxis protein CheW n=1 Tax=Chamaesiphon sp. VAR_48_metabat_403 TaxID=2964700 RepID=UPI00286E7F49|nr:chemotaxis protein CheW [Chamaesiphon sp. VAR_48_metabat_403]
MNLASDSKTHRSSLVVEPGARTQQQFLRFLLQPGLMALIEIDRVMELVNIPISRVVPMPHLPPAVRGVYNWRGEILWIVDLAVLLAGGREVSRKYRSLQPIIILNSIAVTDARTPSTAVEIDPRSDTAIGVIVEEIVEIEWCDLDLISPHLPAHLDPELSKWMRGIWESPTGENFLVLDAPAILDRADVHAIPDRI